ncbi:MAG: ABC transporter ATP-binding protein [Nitrospinae bacterium]|nr:ABC transporter ATP-binding protein [Nitrospinota bacterium]
MAPLIEVKDLHVTFVTRDGVVQAVNGITFALERGKVLTILGESGSGKTVTLRSLVRLLPKTRTRIAGEVRLKGMNLYQLPEDEVQDLRGSLVAMIFQEPMTALDPVYTVGEQIVETLMRHQQMSREEARRRALELFELVQIPSPERRLQSYPHEISGGMRQRAMIAIALACNPEVLLADEPTTALDVTVQAQILYLLRELQARLGMAMIFVTHDLGVAAEIADEVAVMYAGRIVEYGPVRQVLKQPAHPYTQGLMHATVHRGLKGQKLIPIPGQPPDLTRLPPGCSFAPRCPAVHARCVAEFPHAYRLSAVHMARCFLLETPATTC